MGNPKQQRSRETFNRIVAATERLLKNKLFEDLTVQEIVNEADATVGSYYNLFSDKQSLLPELYKRHCEEMKLRLCDFLDEPDLEKDVHHLIHGLVFNIVELHRSQKGLLRALVLQSHCFPEHRLKERPSEMSEVLPCVAKRVADACGESNRRSNIVMAKVGLLMVLATVREIYLYPETSAADLNISEKVIVKQLTRAWLSYLRSSE